MTTTGSSPSGAFSGTLPPSGPTVRPEALVDLELRTAAAALVTLASLPGALRRGGEHRKPTESNARPGAGADRERLFAAPADVTVAAEPAGRLPWAASPTAWPLPPTRWTCGAIGDVPGSTGSRALTSSHVRRAVYLREIGRFLRDTSFSAG